MINKFNIVQRVISILAACSASFFVAFASLPVQAQNDGTSPEGAVVQGSDAMIYGVTGYGAKFGDGCVYKIGTDGSAYQVLRSFGSSSVDAMNPLAGLILGSDHLLYGTTQYGGEFAFGGSVYQIATDDSTYRVIRSLGATDIDGNNPDAPVFQGTDGILYGTCNQGGKTGYGTVFKVGTDGSGYKTLHSFPVNGADGAAPQAGVIEANDGFLYGTTGQGGSASQGAGGTVYKIARDGSGYKVIYSFGTVSNDGAGPFCGLVQASDNFLYGATLSGGKFGDGTIFKIATDGSGYRIVYNFGTAEEDGTSPLTLIIGTDGRLYGTTVRGGKFNDGTVYGIGLDATGYRVLHSFGNSSNDGMVLVSPVFEASDGVLYGTTLEGGKFGDGTLFKITLTGSDYQVLHSFGN